jgi:myo-inositol catabolism protein IolS
MRKISLGKTGEKISIIGQGTWGFDSPYQESDYIPLKNSLKLGIQLGMTMIDTAERYGWGNAEKAVGEVIQSYQGSRDDLFIASKVWGKNLGYHEVIQAANFSCKRMGINTIDLYQIHWPNPLKWLPKTMRAMEELVKIGKIRYIGVSNFPAFLVNWANSWLKKEEIVSNQVYFSLAERKPLNTILPNAKKHNRIVIACSPLGGTKGNQLQDLPTILQEKIHEIAQQLNLTFHQVALAWLISHENVQVIPKAASESHVRLNAGVGNIQLSDRIISEIDQLLI